MVCGISIRMSEAWRGDCSLTHSSEFIRTCFSIDQHYQLSTSHATAVVIVSQLWRFAEQGFLDTGRVTRDTAQSGVDLLGVSAYGGEVLAAQLEVQRGNIVLEVLRSAQRSVPLRAAKTVGDLP